MDEEETMKAEVNILNGVLLYQEMVKMCAEKSVMTVMLAVSGILHDLKDYIEKENADVNYDEEIARVMALWASLKDKLNQEFREGEPS